MALTFDDGPRPLATHRLRHVLNQHNVKATFFIVGKVAVLFPDLLRTLSKDGHEIANHSWSHQNIQKLNTHRLRWELNKTRSLIRMVTGQTTYLFRTPGSTEHYLRKRFVVPRDYELVMWNVHGLDQQGRTRDEIFHQVMDHVKDGDVVLLHNGLLPTAQALECLLPELKARGFEFVTVSELKAIQSSTWPPRYISTFLQG